MSHPLNDIVWCTLAPSQIHGIGVFAIRDIPEGQILGTEEGERGEPVYPKQGELLPEIAALMQDRYLFLEEFDELPNPNFDAYMQCFMNHSDAPNSDGHFALRDIKKGEEITEDFRSFELGEAAKKHYTFL